MGLSSSGDEYCLRGDRALEGIPNKIKVVDDILLYAETFEELIDTLQKVFDACLKNHITLSPDKFNIEMRSFYGMVNQLGSFSSEIASRFVPLRSLLSTKNSWQWTPAHDEAFDAPTSRPFESISADLFEYANTHFMVDSWNTPFERIGIIEAIRESGRSYQISSKGSTITRNRRLIKPVEGGIGFTDRVSRYSAMDLFKDDVKPSTFFIPVGDNALKHFNKIDRMTIKGHIIPGKVLFTRQLQNGFFKSEMYDKAIKMDLSFNEAVTSRNANSSTEMLIKSHTEVSRSFARIADGPKHGTVLTKLIPSLSNIPVSNGVVHFIEAPLVVSTSVLQNLKNYGQSVCSGIVRACCSHRSVGDQLKSKEIMKKAVGFDQIILSMKALTIFLPTNEAFDKIPKEKLEEIVNDEFKLDSKVEVQTLQPIETDITATNGVVHVINQVLGVPLNNILDRLKKDGKLRCKAHRFEEAMQNNHCIVVGQDEASCIAIGKLVADPSGTNWCHCYLVKGEIVPYDEALQKLANNSLHIGTYFLHQYTTSPILLMFLSFFFALCPTVHQIIRLNYMHSHPESVPILLLNLSTYQVCSKIKRTYNDVGYNYELTLLYLGFFGRSTAGEGLLGPYTTNKEKFSFGKIRHCLQPGVRPEFNKVHHNFTYFIPNNKTWKDYEIKHPKEYEHLMAGNLDKVSEEILGRLVVEGSYTLSDMLATFRLKTIGGDELKVHKYPYVINGVCYLSEKRVWLEWRNIRMEITEYDILTTNGVIHIINKILITRDDDILGGISVLRNSKNVQCVGYRIRKFENKATRIQPIGKHIMQKLSKEQVQDEKVKKVNMTLNMITIPSQGEQKKNERQGGNPGKGNEQFTSKKWVAVMNATDRSKLGYLLAGITGFGAVSLLGLSLPFVLPAFRRICLPYVPATDIQVKNVLKFLRKSKGSSVVDLGSGDGRIVIEAAKLGYNSVGIELNPWLVLYSKISALYAGCGYNTKFIRKDIWKTDLSKYDQVIIFGVDEMKVLNVFEVFPYLFRSRNVWCRVIIAVAASGVETSAAISDSVMTPEVWRTSSTVT
ncbi:Protein N-lysine methyltransferase FAM173B [Nymphon striatum]|nr:Protein N-lysine methyltransferase FAM173B [Nymphon striatum]